MTAVNFDELLMKLSDAAEAAADVETDSSYVAGVCDMLQIQLESLLTQAEYVRRMLDE